MLNTPFSCWPKYTEEEVLAVSNVLLSNKVNYWTGTECREFEKAFASWTGSEHALALANGTVALDLALYVLGIGAGDDVVVTPRTFIASVSCVINAGATPVFADVDPETQNISPETIRLVLTPRTRAIICVHLAGMPCEMDPIMDLASENGIFIIEDCAQAHGAKYKGRSVGSIGHIGAWSFCQDKIMTLGGEGGMLTTNNHDWWKKAWSYKDHGKSWEAVFKREHLSGFKWLHETFGTNWRMMEIQAAIGRLQLGRMPVWHSARTRNAERIRATAVSLPVLRVPEVPDHIEHAWYKCYLFVRSEMIRSGWSRDRMIQEINRRGVPCYTGVCPEVYLEKAFETTGTRPPCRLQLAKMLGETSMMFLVHPTLTDKEIEKTCRVLSEVSSLAAIDNHFNPENSSFS
jgi:dTDP-4-amino-4,6-dideoxygalactose transaminase